VSTDQHWRERVLTTRLFEDEIQTSLLPLMEAVLLNLPSSHDGFQDVDMPVIPAAETSELKTDHNRAIKGLRRESLRSSLDVWDAE